MEMPIFLLTPHTPSRDEEWEIKLSTHTCLFVQERIGFKDCLCKDIVSTFSRARVCVLRGIVKLISEVTGNLMKSTKK